MNITLTVHVDDSGTATITVERPADMLPPTNDAVRQMTEAALKLLERKYPYE